ncbi:choice-of-anchor Q domain-containing protein, partial [Candidatus Magnetobacterium casense]
MATYYASPTGAYDAPGTYANPWNVARVDYAAQNTLNPGDTVIFKTGTYTYAGADYGYMIQPKRAGASGNPIVYASEVIHGSIIDGNASGDHYHVTNSQSQPLATHGAHSVFMLWYANYLRFEGLVVRKGLWGGIACNVIPGSNYITIYRCIVHDIGQRYEYKDYYGISGIFCGQQIHDWTLDSNTIYNCGRLNTETTGFLDGGYWMGSTYFPEWSLGHNWYHDHGFYACGLRHYVVNNVFYNCVHGWSISVSPENHANDGPDWRIVNNTFDGTNPTTPGNIGCNNPERMTNMLVSNNIFYQPTTSMIHFIYGYGWASNMIIRNNLATCSSTYSISNVPPTPGPGTIVDNILNVSPSAFFVDAATHDYHLAGTSPAISAAYGPDAPDYDLNQVERPIGEDDSGAYEYEGGFFMATYVKFQDFVEQLCKGVHQLHAAGHTLNVYLTNTTPNVSTHAVKADLAGITEQNGYAAA